MMTQKFAKLSIRLDLPNGARFGPGKAALLTAVDDLKSINGAAKSLNMSYPRALKLILQMNDSFTQPLILAQHGGVKGGGADLTDFGRQVLAEYQSLCLLCRSTASDHLEKLTDMTNQD